MQRTGCVLPACPFVLALAHAAVSATADCWLLQAARRRRRGVAEDRWKHSGGVAGARDFNFKIAGGGPDECSPARHAHAPVCPQPTEIACSLWPCLWRRRDGDAPPTVRDDLHLRAEAGPLSLPPIQPARPNRRTGPTPAPPHKHCHSTPQQHAAQHHPSTTHTPRTVGMHGGPRS